MAFCILAAVSAAQAADGTWTLLSGGGSATGTWSDADTGNWAGGVVADGSGFTADFSTLNITATSTVTLGASRTIGNLTFGDTDTGTAAIWILSNGGVGTRILTLAGAAPTITNNSSGENSRVAINLTLSGTDGLTKDGVGIVSLGNANTYTGGTTISEGRLRARNSAAFSTGTVTVANGAGLEVDNSVNLANTINLNGSSALTHISGVNVLSGTVNLQSASQINMTGASGSLDISGVLNLGVNDLTVSGVRTLTLGGAISGSGILALSANGGTTIISGDNSATYSGEIRVNRATLAVGHNGALGTGTVRLGINDQTSAIRSTDTTARSIGNTITLFGSGGTGNIFLFGSSSASENGDLNFTSTTDIALGATVRRFDVRNKTQFDAGFTGVNQGIILQTGTGTLVLNGSNSYTGATTVNAGTLLVNGSLGSGSAVTVAAGATLGGGGVIAGNTTINGILAPGSSTESLAFGGNLLLQSTANTIMEINGVNRGAGVNGYDAVDLTNAAGILTYDGTLTLTMTGLVANGTYELFAFTAPAQGAFDGVVFAGGAYTGAFSLAGSVWTATSAQGQVFAFDQTTGDLTVVPEPSVCALLTVGLMAVMFVRRKGSR